MQLGKVYFDKTSPYFTEMYKEMLHFPAGKHDDQVDSLAWSVRLTLTKSAPKEKVYNPKPKEKSWKERLGAYTAGIGGSHMCS
jgi:hypothetical protein